MHDNPSEPLPQKNLKPKSFRFHRSGPKELGLAVAGRDYWWRLGRKIALVSAHVSTLLSLVFLPMSLWFVGSIGLSTGWFLGAMLAMLLISLPMGWVVTFLWNSLLALVLLPGIYLGQRLIGEPISRDTTGWIAGSAVAIVGSAGGLFHVGSIGSSTALPLGILGMIAIQIASGLLGIAAAQAGGYLGSLGALRRRRRPNGSGGQRVRFTVWRLMAVTAILSVLLSLFRLAGDFAVPLIISVVVSSILAWAIHRPVAWATNRWLDWRLKKRRAKRLHVRVVA